MKTIWKMFKKLSELDDWIMFNVPAGAKVLSVGNQREQLCVWFEVDPAALRGKQFFRVAGTGHPVHVPCPFGDLTVGDFIGTVLFSDGELVFHVYKESL